MKILISRIIRKVPSLKGDIIFSFGVLLVTSSSIILNSLWCPKISFWGLHLGYCNIWSIAIIAVIVWIFIRRWVILHHTFRRKRIHILPQINIIFPEVINIPTKLFTFFILRNYCYCCYVYYYFFCGDTKIKNPVQTKPFY